LNRSKEYGYLKGLGNFNNQNIINLNYIYDTLLFLRADNSMLETLNFLLIGFKNLTDLIKIIYTKSEIIHLNISEEECTLIAQSFGCKIGKFSIKYLGVSLHWKKIENK
jgi:hypothetical protein